MLSCLSEQFRWLDFERISDGHERVEVNTLVACFDPADGRLTLF